MGWDTGGGETYMPELQDDHTGLQGVSVLRKTLGSNPGME